MSEAEVSGADLLVLWLAAKARAHIRVQQNKIRSFIIISFAVLTSPCRPPAYALVVMATLLDLSPGEVAVS